MTRPTHRRRLTAAAAIAGLLMAGCSSTAVTGGSTSSTSTTTASVASSSSAADSSGSAAPGGASSATFPVTITHALGSTTIPAAPQRVVAVSWQNQDVALALGVPPVAISKATYGGDEAFVTPWYHEKLGTDPIPVLMDETNGLDFGAISNAKPDLILAVYSGITEQDYDTLRKIAPTVAYPENPYATDWKDTTTIIGKALGKESEAAALLADTEAYLTDLGAQFPNLADKSFAYIYPEAAQLDVYVPTDSRVSLLTDIGLTIPPSVEQLAQGATSFFVGVPFEQSDSITSDILIFLVANDAAEQALLANPFVAALPQVQKGAYAMIKGTQLAFAASAPSVLSIPWGFDRVIPLLGAAADKAA